MKINPCPHPHPRSGIDLRPHPYLQLHWGWKFFSNVGQDLARGGTAAIPNQVKYMEQILSHVR